MVAMNRPPTEPPSADQQSPPAWPRLTLHRNDQAVAAAFIVLSLILIAVWCGYQSYLGGRTIDIERAESIAIDFKIDVNQAQWPELALMPNIGEQLAKRIVADRTERGPFKELEELRRVRGIGPKTLESMKPFLQPLPPLQSTAENEPPQSGQAN
jgi:competence protein ComEA